MATSTAPRIITHVDRGTHYLKRSNSAIWVNHQEDDVILANTDRSQSEITHAFALAFSYLIVLQSPWKNISIPSIFRSIAWNVWSSHSLFNFYWFLFSLVVIIIFWVTSFQSFYPAFFQLFNVFINVSLDVVHRIASHRRHLIFTRQCWSRPCRWHPWEGAVPGR